MLETERDTKIQVGDTMATDQEMDASQRAEFRQRLAYPILTAFEKWIVEYYPKALPRGRMSKYNTPPFLYQKGYS